MEFIPMVTAFIAIAILLVIGTSILGSADFADCDSLENSTGADWKKACQNIKTQTIDGYELLGIVLLIIAAVIIIAVVKLLNS